MQSNNKGYGVIVWLITLVVIAGIAAAGWYVFIREEKATTSPGTSQTASGDEQAVSFATPKKSAHFESSTPVHAATLPAVPVDVVIDFNFDLAANSEIKIIKDGKDYGVGDKTIDSNKLSMRRQMDKNAPDGIYTVEYKACWPDGSCHDGMHQFAIDSKLQSSYQDMRGQSSLTIKLSDIKFQPRSVIISTGTKITWINDDEVTHYVNTDSHPAHTHVLDLNSKALSKGDSFSYTFSKTGAYPYHCSAHADQMTATIVVI
ncbi:MAG TPA: plastocyanin/azurin family copper-binding protein [Candidatus Saccharimonadales bacterium]